MQGGAVTALGTLVAYLVSTVWLVLIPFHPTSGAASAAFAGLVDEAARWSAFVRAENAKPGTPGWQITGARAAMSLLAGYADHVSARPGEPVELYVNANGRMSASAYRIGWYGGVGARRIWTGTFTARWQPPKMTVDTPIADAGGLRNAHVDVAPWTPSITMDTTGWPEGHYLIRLDAATASRYVPLTIRSASASGRLVMVSDILTRQAYNWWGGHSLYDGPERTRAGRALAVSFDRPYNWELGAGEFLRYDSGVLQQAERAGLPLAWVTDYDIATLPGLLSGAGGIAFGGHSEYWTVRLRNAVRQAQAAGTNLAVFGANTAYWRARLAGRGLNLHHQDPRPRVMVVTKDARLDPLSAADLLGTTVRWRADPDPEPEQYLIGARFLCGPTRGDWVVTDPAWFGYAGTGVSKGRRIVGIIGPESDVAAPPGQGPPGIDVVAYSRLACGTRQVAHTAVYYVATSGAGVFDAGTLDWSCATQGSCPTHSVRATDAAVLARITRNVLTEFSVAKAGLRHPAVADLAKYWVPW
jgi:hypothetical protein